MAGTVTPTPSGTGEPPIGGKVSASSVLGSVAGIAGGTTALSPVLAPFTAPVAAIAGIGSAIAKLFGGALTHQEVAMLGHIKNRVDTRNSKK